MSRSPANRSVLICGAGIAGAALAGRLVRCGFAPTLIERAPAFRAGGYIIDIWGTGYDLIERYGLLKAARARGYVFDRLRFVDERGREISGFGGEVFRRALQGRFFSVPRAELAQILFDPIEARVEVLYSTTVRAMREDAEGVQVELSGETTRRFDLVVGADGLRSRVRELAMGSAVQFERYLGYCAGSFVAEHYPHRDESTYVSFARPGRQVSRYALRDDRSAFLLVFAAKQPPAGSGHDPAAHRALLRERFGGDGWETREILARLDVAQDLYFDAVSQIRMPRWSRGRVALLGDAAYSPSLLAGAGAAFAMLGAYVLAGELHRAAGDHVRAFAAYEQRLQSFMLRQQSAAAGFARSFTPKTALGVFLRDRVLNLMSIPAIGVPLARRMLGEVYPLPDYE